MADITFPGAVEKWDTFEAACPGKSDNNPFTDYSIKGTFHSKSESVTVEGFYDGGGIYRVRFMPSFEEEYHFEISGNFSGKTYEGSFTATPPRGGNHGPVRVANQYHFAYEDGNPYYSIGTTCYVWELQSDELQKKTLETLARGPFNKIRFCIFPKHYDYNFHEPRSYPYEGTPMDSSVLTKENFLQYFGAMPGNSWDFTRFNPEHFRHIDNAILALRDLGIEADIIVMHPYDRWGFSLMKSSEDDLYWNYVVARYSAYRNVWWSLANEYDLMPQKTIADWERYASIVCKKDPYNHLRSIHNCRFFYDHSRPWITHCSIQRQDLYKSAEFTAEWRARYKKPIVLDEIAYEGNVEHGWGNISGKELVRRFWEASCRGGYAGHGETFTHPKNILWWSHGGELHGESPERFKFLHKILTETPGLGLCPIEGSWDDASATAELAGNGSGPGSGSGYYLYYYSFMRPSFRTFFYDDTHEYQAELIDTWEMTIKNCGSFRGKFRIDMPGKEYMAIRIRRIEH
jgi:hypothetical protein